jgi:hypothetical protein
MVTSKRVEGEVEYNDGEFAEVQTIGIEGIEQGLLLGAIQIYRCNTENMPEDFQRRFLVGAQLSIGTSTEITAILRKVRARLRRIVKWTSAKAFSNDLRDLSR